MKQAIWKFNIRRVPFATCLAWKSWNLVSDLVFQLPLRRFPLLVKPQTTLMSCMNFNCLKMIYVQSWIKMWNNDLLSLNPPKIRYFKVVCSSSHCVRSVSAPLLNAVVLFESFKWSCTDQMCVHRVYCSRCHRFRPNSTSDLWSTLLKADDFCFLERDASSVFLLIIWSQ